MANYVSQLKSNFSIKNIIMLFFILYLPIFSFGIFGPTELFFANYKTFGVIFAEFGWRFLTYGSLFAGILTVLFLFLPHLLQKILLCTIWIFSLCGYVQTMFLNTNLNQIGATLDGYIPSTQTILKNFMIWGAILLLCCAILISSRRNWKKPVFLTSFVLLATQAVAYSTLILSAPEDSVEYIASEYYLSGEEQYTVSSKENVIVFILDTLSNTHLSFAEEVYPDLKETLHDFTYYSNTDCNYVGTFPSVAHILTGYDLAPELKVNDWLYDVWNCDATNRYYDTLHAAGYKVHSYVIEPSILVGTHSLSLLEGKIDNLTNQTQNFQVNHELLYQTLLEMSCYRFMPDYFKPYFDVPNTQYTSIVTYPENIIDYGNPEYYASLCEKELTVNDDNNYLIFQHLNGIHELINDANCVRTKSGTLPDTIKGIFTMLEEYLIQLEELGVYDNSTIIITADHGTHAYPQSVFFIKHANEHHDKLQITDAPITLDELAPTIAEITTGEHDYLGKTIYDFESGEKRERTLYIGTHSSNYPDVKRYDDAPNGSHNIYNLYTYTGNLDDYSFLFDYDICTPVPSADSYY